MRWFIISACGLLLSGCLSLAVPFQPQEIQSPLQGHSIAVAEMWLGKPARVSDMDTGKRYSWFRNDVYWTTAPSHTIAGTRMVNGRNVAALVRSPPIRTTQRVSCRLDIETDRQGKITRISEVQYGMSCAYLVVERKLNPGLSGLLLKLILGWEL